MYESFVVDAGAGRMMKYLVAQQLDEQLDNDAAFMTKWIDGKFTASQRRVLITKWVGNAWDDFCHGGYIHKYFEKTGCLIGTVGANLAKIRLQGLPDYSFNSSSVTFTINLVDSTDSESEASDGDDDSDAFSDEEYDSSDEDIADKSLTDEQSSNSHPCVFAEGDLAQVLDNDGRALCKGTISAPRKTLHGQPVPGDHVVILIREVQDLTGLGNDGFGEPIDIGGYISASVLRIRKVQE